MSSHAIDELLDLLGEQVAAKAPSARIAVPAEILGKVLGEVHDLRAMLDRAESHRLEDQRQRASLGSVA